MVFGNLLCRIAGCILSVKVTNISFQQPMSPFFVVVHDDTVPPVFTLGEASSSELQSLAEGGDTSSLVASYTGMSGVSEAFGTTTGALPPGDSMSFEVTVNGNFPFVSFVSMAVNTNDCFVGISSMPLEAGQTIWSPGYDAGSEENNELCSSIPGPACPDGSGNVASGNGEGFVHIHRGFFGIGGDLAESSYDWRNPMLRIEVE